MSDAKRALLERYLGSARAESASNGASRARRRPAAGAGAGVRSTVLRNRALQPDRHRLAPSFEVIAADHVRSILAIQPRGPFRLGGWCNGGLLAHEMARQLATEGEEADLLILMDPVWLVCPRRLRLLRTMIAGVGRLARHDASDQLDRFLQLRHVYRFHVTCTRTVATASTESRKTGALDARTVRAYTTAVGDQPTSPYPGKVTFFWTCTQPLRPGWREYEASGRSEIHILAGCHMTSLNTHLPELAERLRRVLESAN
ncbi:MAG: hypothetical protein JF922_23210 [Candidatus Dormibacteraeota bacterium]|uniref:Thioesterase domain-containing protein n=1 Tax=Candidatus Nephthysia bennettiae TaxID=3127016 RepID=A0A934N544_9BACT|nr:hypothetical protein [Candidatus Dormibacteraeota bacterium]MBJ7613996.1 hypothetical protein [Candidatus Dormibacteraeota bacterium]